jgi:hypothetical protein
MNRILAACLAVSLTGLAGCKDLAEEIVDEAGEVVRDQKHKVIEGAQDAAIEAADEQRESAVDKLTGGEEEEAGTDDGGESSL